MSFRSQVFTAAHKIYKTDNNINTFSEALKLAWTRYRVQKAIKVSGFAVIEFAKKTGEMRTATATIQTNFKGSAKHPYLVKFDELTDNGTQVRAFDLRRLVSIIPNNKESNIIEQVVRIAA